MIPDLKILIAIISACLGAGFGFLSKSYFIRKDVKYKLTDTIVTRYLDIRDEISEIVSECAVSPDVNNEDWRIKKINDIGKSYYKYFDYVPHEIVRELICLQSCLKSKGRYLFKNVNNDMARIKDGELEDFCYRISSFGNYSHAIYFNLTLGDEESRFDRRVEYQARHTLMMFNKFFTEKNLSDIDFFRPKN